LEQYPDDRRSDLDLAVRASSDGWRRCPGARTAFSSLPEATASAERCVLKTAGDPVAVAVTKARLPDGPISTTRQIVVAEGNFFYWRVRKVSIGIQSVALVKINANV
jgi:hypothetical protein